MKLLIGAIGLGKYQGTTYGFEDGTLEDADYFLYALTQHVKPDHLIVLATTAAKESALPELREWIELENVPISVIDIPNGKDRGEAWSIFNAIVAKYDELSKNSSNIEVYMDVTNGLRSIPILMLSVARYLQQSRKMDLQGIFYGAFDAVGRNDIKPVYQVDSFITTLDWASAIETFLATGNSMQLAEMLETQPLSIENSSQISDTLRGISLALDLVMIEEIHQKSYELVEQIKLVNSETMTDENKVITELLQRLRSEFEPLAINAPQENLRNFLKKNLELVLWYFKRNRYQDAMMVAREWMLTYKMQHKSANNKRKYTNAEIFSRDNRDREDGYHQWMLSEKRELHKDINDLRNLLAHGGFSNQTDIEQMIININSAIASLQKLATIL